VGCDGNSHQVFGGKIVNSYHAGYMASFRGVYTGRVLVTCLSSTHTSSSVILGILTPLLCVHPLNTIYVMKHLIAVRLDNQTINYTQSKRSRLRLCPKPRFAKTLPNHRFFHRLPITWLSTLYSPTAA
jgi:hypothetical protein